MMRLVLIGAYGGTYAMLVVLGGFGGMTKHSSAYYSSDDRLNSILKTVFIPAHEIDKRIRPEFWRIPDLR